jgi:hypothetical protein
MEVSGQLHAPSGGWAGPTACLDAIEGRRLYCPCPLSQPHSSAAQHVACHCTDGVIAQCSIDIDQIWGGSGCFRSGISPHRIDWRELSDVVGAVPATGHGGPLGCETSGLPHILDIRLTDGGEVVGLTHRPPLPPRKIPGTHFCQRLSRPQGHSAAGRIRSIETSNDLIGNRTCDLLACNIVPQPTTLPRVTHKHTHIYESSMMDGWVSGWDRPTGMSVGA